MAAEEPIKLPDRQGANSLTPEQRDTARLIDQLLGKSLSDRYVDFCRLCAGDFDLRVGSPMAGHALRELDSILRSTLAAPLDAKIEAGLDKTQLKEVEKALKALDYDDEAINRAKAAVAPRVNHGDQIKKIVARLGLDPGGDVARNWLSVREAAAKAHERPFNRDLKVDDDFRETWAKPFDNVIRGIVVALQGYYSALAKRVETLASMENTAKAVGLFASEIPGALPLQWLFFRNIQGARWLPELIKRNLILPPQTREPDDENNGIRFREWPVGAYLLTVAITGSEHDRALLAKALRNLKASEHPDFRQAGLEILSGLPGKEAAELADLAIDWLSDENGLFFAAHSAETLLKNIADSGNAKVTLRLAEAMLRLHGHDGQIRSNYPHHMYEHYLPKTAKILIKTVGIDGIRLLVNLLYQAGVLDRKIRETPPGDYTNVISGPLTSKGNAYDIFGALVLTVAEAGRELIQRPNALVEEIVFILMNHEQHIFTRLAYLTLSYSSQKAPDLSDILLCDQDALASYYLKFEYGELAKARLPHMADEKRAELFHLIDTLPAKHEAAWRNRFEEHEKRPPDENNVRTYRMAVVRDAEWEWRDVLPDDRKKALDAIVAEIKDPDAWLGKFRAGEQSPMSPDDFKARSPEEVAEYLRTWKPDAQNSETKTALAFELYKAVQAEADKYAAGAAAFKGLSPIYVRRYFEGLRYPAQNKAEFGWTKPLELLETILPLVTPPTSGERSSGGDDPSWFWAALEGAQLLRAGLQQGKEGVEYINAELVKRLISAIENAAPPKPEIENFEQQYLENPFFAAEKTMLGLAVELRMLELFWLSKQEGSFVAKSSRDAIRNSPDFADSAERALAAGGANGRVVHAIVGKYLDWLFYFGSAWVEANIQLIFPQDKALREAAWLGHLINGSGPVLPLTGLMRELYAEETEHLLVPRNDSEREWRQDHFGEYVLLQYLFGDYSKDLLERFFETAPARLRGHVISSLGQRLHKSQTSEEARTRGMAYFDMRLAAASDEPGNKEAFGIELEAIGHWLHNTDLDPAWLIDRMLRMLRLGFAPGHAYSVVEYASDIAETEPAGAVALIGELFKHPKTEQWAYTTQQPAIRKILETGIATGDPEVRSAVERTISFLVSRGETSFLDLSAAPTAKM